MKGLLEEHFKNYKPPSPAVYLPNALILLFK